MRKAESSDEETNPSEFNDNVEYIRT